MQHNAAEAAEQGAPCVLNPLYESCVVQRFDVDHGYQAHHWKCVQVSPRVSSPHVDGLGLNGFEVRRALDPDHAARMADSLQRHKGKVSAEELGAQEVEAVMRAVFNPAVHETINRNFLTEFAVIYFGLASTEPSAQSAGPSMRWHCDFGPSKFLNILVYLNGDQEHDGATAFLDRQATHSFKRLGYVFCPVDQRLGDLSDLAKEHGLSYTPKTLTPEPGEAIIFEPSSVLHRGIAPTRGVRHTLHLVVIPWAEPWDTFLHKNFNLLTENRDFRFPKLT